MRLAAAAMAAGLVSPAHLVVATFPCAQGSQRVTDATTLEKAQKKRLSSSKVSPSEAAAGPSTCGAKPTVCTRSCTRSCVVVAASAGGRAASS